MEPYWKAAAFLSLKDDAGEYFPLASIGRTSPNGKFKIATRLTEDVPWLQKQLILIKAWPGLLGCDMQTIREIEVTPEGKIKVLSSYDSPSSFSSSFQPQEETHEDSEDHTGQ